MINMKKILYTAATMAILASCAESEMIPQVASSEPLRIVSGIGTRVAGTQWEGDEVIGVTIYSSGQTIAIGEPYSRYQTSDVGTTASFSPAAGVEDLFYPQSGAVDVIAYYPYRVPTSGLLTLDLEEQDNQEAIDLLWAKAEEQTKSREAVTLAFEHQLTKIVVELETAGYIQAEDLYGATLSIEGIYVDGEFDLHAGVVATATNATPTSVVLTGVLNSSNMSGNAIVLPQTSKPTFRITTQSNIEYSVTAPAQINFGQGEIHTFVITVSNVELELSAKISPWIESEHDLEISDTMLTLEQIDADNIPSGDVWTISDSSTDSESDFADLRAAIAAAVGAEPTRQITLNFPNLSGKLPLASFSDVKGVVAISMPKVTYIDNKAFYNCTSLSTISLPKATHIGDSAFSLCTALTTLNIGYDLVGDNHATITFIHTRWGVKDSAVDLMIGYIHVEDGAPTITVDLEAKTVTVDKMEDHNRPGEYFAALTTTFASIKQATK